MSKNSIGSRIFKNQNILKIKPSDLLNNLTDEDLVFINESGKLEDFCYALSLDLQPKKNEKSTTYTT